MASISEELKYKAISLLQQQKEPGEIADELDISYSGVLKLKKEFNESVLNGTLDALINTDKLVIQEAGELLGMEGEAKVLVQSLTGLEKLSVELQVTAMRLNQRISSLILSVEHPSELQTYAKIICDLNESFLNKASTTVNIQNNIGGDNAGTKHYGKYLSDAPGS